MLAILNNSIDSKFRILYQVNVGNDFGARLERKGAATESVQFAAHDDELLVQ
jgi:hypothetical protein